MDIRPAVRAALLSDATVAGIVAARIYPMQAEQGERQPLIVINRISEFEEPTLQGSSGLLESRVQVDAWAETIDAASALAAAARARLQGLVGAFVGLAITGVFAGTVRERRDAETKMFCVGRDYRVYTKAG